MFYNRMRGMGGMGGYPGSSLRKYIDYRVGQSVRDRTDRNRQLHNTNTGFQLWESAHGSASVLLNSGEALLDGWHLKILIADDHEAVRKGVCFILGTRDDLKVCAEACNGFEAIEKTIELRPDLIIMDVTMPGMDGLAACQQIKRFQPQIPILIFSQHDGSEIVQLARQAKAQAFVTKSAAAAVLLKAIDALLAGKTFFPDETAQPLSKAG
jgi:CheY-like chemotaxis protein